MTREEELEKGIKFSMDRIESYKNGEEDCTNYTNYTNCIRKELAKVELYQAELKGIKQGRLSALNDVDKVIDKMPFRMLYFYEGDTKDRKVRNMINREELKQRLAKLKEKK